MLFQKGGTRYKVAEKVGRLETGNDHATKKKKKKPKAEEKKKKTLSKTIMYHGTKYTESI